MHAESKGMWLGFIGVAIFSLTLPATRIAVMELHPAFVALGHAVVAAVFAMGMLWYLRAPRPNMVQLKSLFVVVLGVVIGFPLLSSIAMRDVPASHGAVVLGVLPLATALFAALRFGERPSSGFWITALIGSAIVVVFAFRNGGDGISLADIALFAAVVAAAMGYAEGGRLSQSMGGNKSSLGHWCCHYQFCYQY